MQVQDENLWVTPLRKGGVIGAARRFGTSFYSHMAHADCASMNHSQRQGFWFNVRGRYLGFRFMIKGRVPLRLGATHHDLFPMFFLGYSDGLCLRNNPEQGDCRRTNTGSRGDYSIGAYDHSNSRTGQLGSAFSWCTGPCRLAEKRHRAERV